ncbi:hypothetical protein Nepgr_020876 [Nepenthes gracilis]|uniref:Uncharacterized protein n=1 Tax=Nepenthes gracilis TaxID=150966 RepID=A0AAD3XWN5_NEPGR|nr:hypothetical protein Nepgr_020876 [Nepenthes gracilis]
MDGPLNEELANAWPIGRADATDRGVAIGRSATMGWSAKLGRELLQVGVDQAGVLLRPECWIMSACYPQLKWIRPECFYDRLSGRWSAEVDLDWLSGRWAPESI